MGQSRNPKRPKDKKAAPVPSKEQILAFIRESKSQVGKREIARAFGLKGAAKMAVKGILKELALEGAVSQGHKQRFGGSGVLPSVDVIEVTHTDRDGDLFAKPKTWDSKDPPPSILVVQKPGKGKERRVTVNVGDRVLAKLIPAGDNAYEARPIKKLSAAPARLLGVVEVNEDGSGTLRPVDKKYRYDVRVPPDERSGAKTGDLVAVDVYASPKFGPQKARVVEKLGRVEASRNLSLIAIHERDIPHNFSDEAVAQAQKCGPAPLGSGTDLRGIPLVTIDGEDARDFDDAVWAEPDTDPKNPGGWHLLVAIADVAWYVRPGDALDRGAYERGNSVYFPDRVVPMLPEALSNGWCSLKPREDRSCLAAHMWIDAEGKLLRHKIVRGLMHSVARLTYAQVQRARDGHPDEMTGPLMARVINPLYGAYEALDMARRKRGTLDLDLVERKIIVDRNGVIQGVEPRPRYDSHKLIEEFMICANVATAEVLAASSYPATYRVHEPPDPERVAALRESLATLDLKLPNAGQLRPADFNRVLSQVRGTPHETMVNTLVLRTQSQAVYSPDNLGHFGLGLRKYVHFTSPIRRYSDLMVHRALIAACRLGEGGWDAHRDPDMDAMTDHISMTERRAAMAERQTVDRFTAAFLADRTGAIFQGRVSGVSRFGVFVSLNETGADGILPMRQLPQDFYDLDEKTHRIMGRRNGLELRVGDPITVKLLETDEIAGSIVFSYAGTSPRNPAGTPRHPRGRDRNFAKKTRRKK